MQSVSRDLVQQFKVFMSPEAGMNVQKTLYSGFIGQGQIVEEFEEVLSKRLGIKVLSVNSGTSALQLALRLINKPNQYVFTTPLTCFATTAAILNSGMKPYWIDVDPNTCNIDLNDLKINLRRIRPAAIMVVHYGGYPVDLKELNKLADGIPVVEDCAHAFGSETPEGHVGTLYGNYGCFSFQAIKTLTTGDGGAIIVPNHQYDRAKKMRWFGLSREESRDSQNIQEAGFKYHMNDISATIGLANIKHVDNNLRLQRENVNFYQNEDPLSAPLYHKKFITSGWMYPLKVHDAKSFNSFMKLKNISTGLCHARNDTHECVKKYRKYLPGLEHTLRTMSCIPSGWWIDNETRKYIVECICEERKIALQS